MVLGGEGDDLVRASFGDDTYEGGKGFDTIDFRGATQGVTVDMSKGTVAGLGVTTVQGFERIVGTSFADDIKGTNDADVIEAGSGRNTIRGAGGADDLTGGFKQDTFVWKSTDVLDAAGQHRGVDTIHGFETNDTLDIRSLLKGTVYGSLDEVVHLTDTDAGTMLQVKQGGNFVDVALLADTHFGGPSATAWATDGIILA
jgi:serralysin